MVICVSTALAMGQNSYVGTTVDAPVDMEQVSETSAYVTGHWVGDDLAGPSTSEIFCQHKSMVCEDNHAEMVVMGGGVFSLVGGQDTYRIERWTPNEIVASNVSGACDVHHVIKFDRVHKRVFYMQTLSEPEASGGLCSWANLSSELRTL